MISGRGAAHIQSGRVAGRKLVIAAMVVTLTVGGPVVAPDDASVEAQGTGCSCFASFDGVDSDLRFVARYSNSTTLAVGGLGCAAGCDGWRRDWFYRDACDNPTRINRGTKAWWGYEAATSDTFIGPDTWWCPFPPP